MLNMGTIKFGFYTVVIINPIGFVISGISFIFSKKKRNNN